MTNIGRDRPERSFFLHLPRLPDDIPALAA
jgi:hypothetical protein